ncbi:ribonuclease H-like domain-containing protein [Tanacetum coccineum]
MIGKLDLEELDIKWQMAMLSVRINRFEKKAGRKMKFNNKDAARFDKKKVKCYKCSELGHFARECTGKQLDSKARYVVPTGKDNVIVSAGRTKVIPAGRTILVLGKAEEIDLPVPKVDIIISEWTGDTALYIILPNGSATVSPVTYFAFVSKYVNVVGDCIIPKAPIGVKIIFSNL